ncbi:MAG: peptidoglycan-associated lipoprotein [Phenylobacterium zucineum]|nr:MAG: peptidoglycan-associated lipoprotein [Phenylobacterium zucineum]
MNFDTGTAFRLCLVAAAALSMTACGSRPKPELATPTPPVETPYERPTQPAYQPPPRPPVDQGPLAGSVQDFVIKAGDLVYFDVAAIEVRPDAIATLKSQAAWLNRYPAVQVRIEGNADERGTREYNLSLGARRANSVRDFLISQGVAPSRISTVSYGKEKPIDPGTNDEAYQRNRNAHTALVGGAR